MEPLAGWKEGVVGWMTADDLTLNLSTELIGVGLSIPLSVLIAAWLDRSADRRRMRRSLSAAILTSEERISYLLSGFVETMRAKLNQAPDAFIAQQIAETSLIARRTVEQAFGSVRAIHGDRLGDDVRIILFQLEFQWQRVERLLSLDDEWILDLLDQDEDLDRIEAQYADFLKAVLRAIVRLNGALSQQSAVRRENGIDDAVADLLPVLRTLLLWRQQRAKPA